MDTFRRAASAVWTRIGAAVRWVTADRTEPPQPPSGNWIPNSNGEGGKVISSGHPGGQ